MSDRRNLNLPQYQLYKFDTFKFFTDKENELYTNYKNAKRKEDKDIAKKKLEEGIKRFEGVRTISEKQLTYKNRVAWFTNDLLNLFVNQETKKIPLVEEIIIIQIYHDDIFNQIMDNGFYCRNKKYLFYTAGAGQTRENTLTFISEEALEKHRDYLMGGLTDKKINENGGINTGKLLSYKALTMSAGNPIEIPCEKVIFVPDFETILKKEVQFIDTKDKNLPITKESKDVPVNHMDGAGMILPEKIEGISGNWQFRNKWCKGALVEFEFLKFAKEVAGNTIVRDIYQVDHDIEKEDIWIILTCSQFKMSNHYESWQTFIYEMKRIGSKFYVCNKENPPQEEKELSYQYLQTLDIPVEDTETIAKLCQPTIDYIKKLHNDKDEALKALGATEENKNLKPLQEALIMYPQLLQDEHVKTQIKKVVKSIRNDAKGGRILSSGFYSYIFPDVYAFCQKLFQNIENPEGLIPEGYVYNAYHNVTKIEKVDLLRSPHLHPSEHCVRKLIKTKECQDWFRGNATYVSVHDLAQLQMKNDVDGDICYVGTAPELIKHVRKDCLPLYYKMPKAPKQEVNQENIKHTLKKAFEANQIGYISNTLTKYLSLAYDKDFELDMDFIARLQAWNNFTIDFPKTGENIELPEDDKKLYESLIDKKSKSPYFFQWAKNKSDTAVAPCGNGVVDRISKYIQKHAGSNKYVYFEKDDPFDPEILNRGIKVFRDTKLYNDLQNLLFQAENDIGELNKKLIELKHKEPDNEIYSRYDIVYQIYRDKMIELFNKNARKCVDYLVDIEYYQEYRKNKSRNILWNCFGWEVLKNINDNLDSKRELKARVRFAYGSDKEPVEKVKQKLEAEMKPISVIITNKEYEKTKSIDDENERKLYYVLLCLSKLNKEHKIKLKKNIKFKSTNKKKKPTNTKMNINTLNNLAGITNAEAILNRFKQSGVIRRESGVISLADFDQNQDDICFMVNNIWRPLVSLGKHEGKSIGECEICGEEFIKVGNTKTCSPRCSEENTRRNKQEN